MEGWSYKPRNNKGASKQQKLEETRKDLPLELSEGAQPHGHLDVKLLASRIIRE